MAWFRLTDDIPDILSDRQIRTAPLSRPSLNGGAQRGSHRSPSSQANDLGAAVAGSQWSWASAFPTALRPSADTAVSRLRPPHQVDTSLRDEPATSAKLRISQALLRLMAEAAHADGRDESDVWAEAAREWLRQRDQHNDPEPPTPAAAHLPSTRSRGWAAIDTLLTDLRQRASDSDAA